MNVGKSMKSKKRIFAWLLTMCMIMSLMSNQYMVVAHAEDVADETVYTITEALALSTIKSIEVDGAEVEVVNTSDVLKINFPYNTSDESGNIVTVDNIADRMSYKLILPAQTRVELVAEYRGVVAEDDATKEINSITVSRYSDVLGLEQDWLDIANYTEGIYDTSTSLTITNENTESQEYLVTMYADGYIGDIYLSATTVSAYYVEDTTELATTSAIPTTGEVIAVDETKSISLYQPYDDTENSCVSYFIEKNVVYTLTVPAKSALRLNGEYKGEADADGYKKCSSINVYDLEEMGYGSLTEAYMYIYSSDEIKGSCEIINESDAERKYVVAVNTENFIGNLELSVTKPVECGAIATEISEGDNAVLAGDSYVYYNSTNGILTYKNASVYKFTTPDDVKYNFTLEYTGDENVDYFYFTGDLINNTKGECEYLGRELCISSLETTFKEDLDEGQEYYLIIEDYSEDIVNDLNIKLERQRSVKDLIDAKEYIDISNYDTYTGTFDTDKYSYLQSDGGTGTSLGFLATLTLGAGEGVYVVDNINDSVTNLASTTLHPYMYAVSNDGENASIEYVRGTGCYSGTYYITNQTCEEKQYYVWFEKDESDYSDSYSITTSKLPTVEELLASKTYVDISDAGTHNLTLESEYYTYLSGKDSYKCFNGKLVKLDIPAKSAINVVPGSSTTAYVYTESNGKFTYDSAINSAGATLSNNGDDTITYYMWIYVSGPAPTSATVTTTVTEITVEYLKGLTTITVDSNNQANLKTDENLIELGFDYDKLVSITSNGILDAETGVLTVEDIDKAVTYTYEENNVTYELQFIPYRSTDTSTTVESEKVVDTEKGETTTTYVEVTNGEISGQIDVIEVETNDEATTIVVTENKDATGEALKDASINVTQDTISEEVLEQSIEIAQQKTEEYKQAESDVEIVEIKAEFKNDTANTEISKNILDMLKNAELSLEITKKNGDTVEYTWYFDKEQIKGVQSENMKPVDTKVTVHKESTYANNDKIEEHTKKNAVNCVLEFKHEGNLPGETTITVNVDGKYENGSKLFYYHYDSVNNKMEYTGEAVVENGFVPVKLTHCSDYVLTDMKIETEEDKEIVCETHTVVIDKEAVAPTCTEKGYTEASHCSVCNEIISVQTEIPALGHSVVVDPAVEATVDREGKTEGAHCSRCGEIITAQETTPKLPSECWTEIDGKEYYLGEDGEPVKDDWAEIDGEKYYFNKDGEKATGWLLDEKDWYYLEDDGTVATGWVQDGATWYYMEDSGKMATGWVLDGATWYYMNPSGAMATGWVQDGAIWYYMNPSGAMATGWVQDGAIWYYMNPSGAMATGWVLDGATWYYMNPSGAMATGWVLDGATWYYMNPSGAMATGWVLDGETWYYMNPSGAMATGWILDGSNWYFMYSSGAMAHDTVIAGFRLNSSGAWVR